MQQQLEEILQQQQQTAAGRRIAGITTTKRSRPPIKWMSTHRDAQFDQCAQLRRPWSKDVADEDK